MFKFPCSNAVEIYELNRMSLFKSFWTVEGISPNARNAALRAAEAEGEDLGVWLSRLINKVSVAERDAAAATTDSAEDNGDIVEASNTNTAAEDDKLSSIERAMLQSRASGDV
ncbi:MAG: hypothetical protein O3C34_12990 [Proteobacteria bacterium]|nr:hypothetical protein [Pseudomonadota bacterium]